MGCFNHARERQIGETSCRLVGLHVTRTIPQRDRGVGRGLDRKKEQEHVIQQIPSGERCWGSSSGPAAHSRRTAGASTPSSTCVWLVAKDGRNTRGIRDRARDEPEAIETQKQAATRSSKVAVVFGVTTSLMWLPLQRDLAVLCGQGILSRFKSITW